MTSARGSAAQAPRSGKLSKYLVILLISGGLFATAALLFIRQPTSSAYTRGERLAREVGCTGCHGPGGLSGIRNPLSSLAFVPSFRSGGSAQYRVQSFDDFRAWVVYGEPRPQWIEAPMRSRYSVPDGLIRMPAFGSAVSERDLTDLYAFYKAVGNRERPAPSQALKGRMLADQHGCFGCHGSEGRGGTANPGSLKGQIPAWDGDDFAELVTSEEELREWIREGRSGRIDSMLLARLFTRNQVIQMPAYKDILNADEVDAIVDYIQWLRSPGRETSAYWVDPDASLVQEPAARGQYLFGYAGCASCHDTQDSRGYPNPNALGDEIPAASGLAEKLQIMVRVLQNDERLGIVHCSTYREVQREYNSMRQLIIRGSIPAKRDRLGPTPPVKMPAWSERGNHDGSPMLLADIDSILAFLISRQNAKAPDLETLSRWLDKGALCEEDPEGQPEASRATGHERALAAMKTIDVSDRALDTRPSFEFSSFDAVSMGKGEHYNRIQLFTPGLFDIWVLRQRTHGASVELLSIVVDNGVRPKTAYYFEFAEDLTPVILGLTCFECHANGPRALRPMRSENIEPLSPANWEVVRDFNDRIVSQGMVKSHIPEHQARILWSSKPESWGTRLELTQCYSCHDSEGIVRSTLRHVHRQPATSLTYSHLDSEGYTSRNAGDEKSSMPADGWLSQGGSRCMQRWLQPRRHTPPSMAPWWCLE